VTITSTLQLACPTCGDEIEIECGVNECDGMAEVVSLRTWCFHAISREDAYRLLLDEGARQAELATERAGERP
jgi:hypothetical protein